MSLKLPTPDFDALKKILDIKSDIFDKPNIAKLKKSLENLPSISPSKTSFTTNEVSIGSQADLNENQKTKIRLALENLKPWRKGPFNLFGIEIDAEWDAALKWDRLEKHLNLKHKKILDIGCNNGYYMFRMLAQNPELVIGIDPFPRVYYQFLLLQHFAKIPNLEFYPIGFEDLTPFPKYFDTVFCMGIIYHHRSPFEVLKMTEQCMKKGGELILETLCIDSPEDVALCPRDRYADMRNVYFIPSFSCLKNWLLRSGFENIEKISQDITTSAEQRKTAWNDYDSLKNGLSKTHQSSQTTIEGYPAPERICVKATCRL